MSCHDGARQRGAGLVAGSRSEGIHAPRGTLASRRGFLGALATAGAGLVLGRSMVTVPGLWTPPTIRAIDDPLGFQVGDLIRRHDGAVYKVTSIERDGPVGAELAIVSPVVEVRTLEGELVDGPLSIYRHRFEHDGEYFHIGTSKARALQLSTWHPNYWKKSRWNVEPPWARPEAHPVEI